MLVSLLFFSTVGAAMYLVWSWKHCTLHVPESWPVITSYGYDFFMELYWGIRWITVAISIARTWPDLKKEETHHLHAIDFKHNESKIAMYVYMKTTTTTTTEVH